MKPMKAYDWILFDADDTLFHFDAFRGLQRMFAGFAIDFTASTNRCGWNTRMAKSARSKYSIAASNLGPSNYRCRRKR